MSVVAFLRRLVIVLSALMGGPGLDGFAAEVTFPDLADAVPGKPDTTYLDLARKIMPDLAPADGTYRGTKLIELRHIGGPDLQGFPPEDISLPGIAALPVRSGGRDRLALLLDLRDSVDAIDGFAVLALFDLTAAPALLDAADVAYDRGTYFRDPPVMAVADGTDVLVAISVHFNSSQSYIVTPLVMVRDDRLELIDAIRTFDEAHCDHTRNQTLELKVLPTPNSAFATIEATVTDVTKLTGRTCGSEDEVAPATRTVMVNYKWNAAATRYEPDSDALEKLDAENETRY